MEFQTNLPSPVQNRSFSDEIHQQQKRGKMKEELDEAEEEQEDEEQVRQKRTTPIFSGCQNPPAQIVRYRILWLHSDSEFQSILVFAYLPTYILE